MSELEPKRVRDRISALPDAVLCHIPSFLSTDEAVATYILSKRWKKVWASVPNLDFDDSNISESVPFLRFVDNVLFYRDSTDIQTFRLQSSCIEDFARIRGWIETAVRRNVVELDISVEDYAGDEDHPRVLELPERVFRFKTLVNLVLRSNFIINPPASGCFPSVKSLIVYIGHLVDKSIEKLFSCCPVLENLYINGSHGMQRDPILNLNISAPELKTLRIFWSSYDVYEKCCKFHINAPKLENFHLWQDPPIDCFFGEF